MPRFIFFVIVLLILTMFLAFPASTSVSAQSRRSPELAHPFFHYFEHLFKRFSH